MAPGRTATAQRQRAHSRHGGAGALTQRSQQFQQSLWRQWEFDPEYVAGSLVLLGSEASTNNSSLRWPTGRGRHPCEALDATQTRLREPALGEETTLAGALYFPQAGAAMACHADATPGSAVGRSTIRDAAPGAEIAARRRRAHRTPAVAGRRRPRSHDAIVVCAGAEAAEPAHAAGPAPAHDRPARLWRQRPFARTRLCTRHAIVDWSEQMTLVRLGQRMRIVAGAELAAAAPCMSPHCSACITASTWFFPAARCWPQAYRSGMARACGPMDCRWWAPAELPAAANLGHGGCGAAIAQGCASMLSDLMDNRASFLDRHCSTRAASADRPIHHRAADRYARSMLRIPTSTALPLFDTAATRTLEQQAAAKTARAQPHATCRRGPRTPGHAHRSPCTLHLDSLWPRQQRRRWPQATAWLQQSLNAAPETAQLPHSRQLRARNAPTCQTMHPAWDAAREAGVQWTEHMPADMGPQDLCIDALLGIGLRLPDAGPRTGMNERLLTLLRSLQSAPARSFART
ncbi:Protein TOPAZ1 [Manis javanica]|nr:Protein TOPAZ1 [Manis javanica]